MILQRREPEFVGGVRALGTFIMHNYHYPEWLLKANVSGGTDIKFRVTERGMVDSIRILKSPGFGADEEAIRLIKLTSGKWKPGRINGKVVAMDYYLPLRIDPE